jgi:hypothetical protein
LRLRGYTTEVEYRTCLIPEYLIRQWNTEATQRRVHRWVYYHVHLKNNQETTGETVGRARGLEAVQTCNKGFTNTAVGKASRRMKLKSKNQRGTTP